MGKPCEKPPRRTQKLAIKRLRLDFQPEENLSDAIVDKYSAAIARGEKIEPILVVFDGTEHWVKNGFHRVGAARRNRRRKIEAEVVQGTYADMEAEWKQVLETIKQELRNP